MIIYFSYTPFLGVTNKRPFYRRKSQIEFYNQQQATAAAVAEAVGLHQKSSSVKIENLKTERREGNPLVVGGGSSQAETTTAVNGMLDDEDRSDGKVRHLFLTLKVNASAMTKWRPNRLGDLMVT